MALSEAQASLNAIKFDGNSDLDLHVSDLRTKRLAVNDLRTTPLTDQEFRGIIYSINPPHRQLDANSSQSIRDADL